MPFTGPGMCTLTDFQQQVEELVANLEAESSVVSQQGQENVKMYNATSPSSHNSPSVLGWKRDLLRGGIKMLTQIFVNLEHIGPVASSPQGESLNAVYQSPVASMRMFGLLEDDREQNEQLETAYLNIGRWKGPTPPRELRRQSREFWFYQGESGIRWLLIRLRRERNIDALDGVASLLASLGPIVLTPILDELDSSGLGSK